MYCDPACKPWTSRSWAPEGFSTRQEFVEWKMTSGNDNHPAEKKGNEMDVEHDEHAPRPNGAPANQNSYANGGGATAV